MTAVLKHKGTTLVSILAIMAFVGVVVAQKGTSIVTRIKFERGRTTAIEKGSVHRGMSHDYLLKAGRGQAMTVHLATSGGFMEVTPAKAVLLTESAEEVASIDLARAEESKKRAQERLALAAGKDVDKSRAKEALERAENRLRLARKYKK